MKMGGDHKTFAARAAGVERDRTILELRIKGAPPSAIAKSIGVTERTVFAACSRALSKVDFPGAAEAKQRMLLRLDALRMGLFAKFDASIDVPSTSLVARAIIAVEQREAALLGLDLPQALIIASLPVPPDKDKVTMSQLDRLEPDELRTLHAILKKACDMPSLPAIETTATAALPPAPDFDDDPSTSPIGESKSEQKDRRKRP